MLDLVALISASKTSPPRDILNFKIYLRNLQSSKKSKKHQKIEKIKKIKEQKEKEASKGTSRDGSKKMFFSKCYKKS